MLGHLLVQRSLENGLGELDREVADVVTFPASPRGIAISGDAVAVGGGLPGPVYC